MEAKDKQYIQQEIRRKFPSTDPEIDIDWDMMEISFKAGVDEGFILSKVTDPVLSSKAEHKELNTRAKAYLDAVKTEGRREIVEYLETLRDRAQFINVAFMVNDEWQAKLKSWGIND